MIPFLDLQAQYREIGPELDGFQARFPSTRLILELGRYLVGPAGYFVTRVVSVKQSRGSRIAICDGGLNGNLAASGNFGMVLRRNYVMHRVGDPGDRAEEKQDISGPLCTSIDALAGPLPLPRVARGDRLAVLLSGAYGLTASPTRFISHPDPVELMLDGDSLRDVSETAMNHVLP
mgnify:CR=1 FL=1